MENKKLSIVLDQAVVDQLNLSKGQQLKAELYNDKLVLKKRENQNKDVYQAGF